MIRRTRFKAGVCDPRAVPELIVDAGAIALPDGRETVGRVAAAMQPLAALGERMNRYIEDLKSVPRLQGCDEVFHPGEIEARNDLRSRKDGSPLADDTIRDVRKLAESLKLEAPF